MIDALPPEMRERILREQAEQFACDAPQDASRVRHQPTEDERAP